MDGLNIPLVENWRTTEKEQLRSLRRNLKKGYAGRSEEFRREKELRAAKMEGIVLGLTAVLVNCKEARKITLTAEEKAEMEELLCMAQDEEEEETAQ